jgi:hypothetical protein
MATFNGQETEMGTGEIPDVVSRIGVIFENQGGKPINLVAQLVILQLQLNFMRPQVNKWTPLLALRLQKNPAKGHP